MAIPLLTEKKVDFQKAVDHFKDGLGKLRSGRATPALIEDVLVEAYNSQMPVKGVASIAIPDAKTLTIEPWDASLIEEIVRALTAANLGMAPNVQGKLIRLVMPPMTEERRTQIVKVVKERTEEARKALRNIREKIREQVITMERDKKISEDDRFRAQDELDKMTKQFVADVDRLAEEKEKEIMTV
ncbi:ribosome recycling factor [Candidatus Uhrbacteria bacterium]|nr:ribosome recycling factor [Candidatus Uhrbacteria bacterium]